ncbi:MULTISPECIES: hypothetical protein [Nonomuraea]|uniref:hypothetical protein n=1 Tax=Nonomuraea TaxID=83681 RepID=UPI001C600ECF|nr:hypothetical protein [Nonomuraea ceibae]
MRKLKIMITVAGFGIAAVGGGVLLTGPVTYDGAAGEPGVAVTRTAETGLLAGSASSTPDIIAGRHSKAAGERVKNWV